ncbi:MAG: hypothetical protein U1A27_13800 [Phycisphaerae bacterium]
MTRVHEDRGLRAEQVHRGQPALGADGVGGDGALHGAEIGSGNYDRTIDIYALGVMLYEMLLGKVPFAGATAAEILMKHLTAQPEVDALPAPFPAVLRKALAKDPHERFQTIPEMMSALFGSGELETSLHGFEGASLTRAARQVGQAVGMPPPLPAGRAAASTRQQQRPAAARAAAGCGWPRRSRLARPHARRRPFAAA